METGDAGQAFLDGSGHPFRRGVRQQAQQRGLRLLVVEGKQTIEEAAFLLQDHFGFAAETLTALVWHGGTVIVYALVQKKFVLLGLRQDQVWY